MSKKGNSVDPSLEAMSAKVLSGMPECMLIKRCVALNGVRGIFIWQKDVGRLEYLQDSLMNWRE